MLIAGDTPKTTSDTENLRPSGSNDCRSSKLRRSSAHYMKAGQPAHFPSTPSITITARLKDATTIAISSWYSAVVEATMSLVVEAGKQGSSSSLARCAGR
eukprot:TRINITY_DN8554_c0_g1_i3.p2 TRINITY_DN8554_c0_g1~~TRINITY_DN8554_c0_g1_i3.p2  ORF type:complete len:100 (+),score=10.17 TRINITY_DN8554_c0_g1_i3:100-399(+)